MKRFFFDWMMGLGLWLGAAGLMAAEPVAVAVGEKVDLLQQMAAGEMEFHINPEMDFHDPAEEVFQLKAGELHISGRGYGYMVTKVAYKDYHLVVDFKWGPKTWGKRAERARDNGILVHSYGPHGAYANTWMASIEAQIIEGGIGDILVLSPKLADGTELITSVTAEIERDRDGERVWKKGAPRETVLKGRINWEKRDVDWADKINFRGKDDPDSPVGEWNRLEVIAKGDTLVYLVNGRVVNEAFECKPAEGRICIQTEGAEMIVRHYALYPLGGFTEKWNPISASGGSEVPVRLGQEVALSAEESMKGIELDGEYEVQLVAAEPLVVDPVEVTWDAEGRLFVAEMRDYPLGPEPGKPWLSRVTELIDVDGDGRMDEARVFADELDHVQGLLPYDGGLIATTRTEILFLKDSTGDGRADVIRPLIKGLNPKHSQLQVSSPRWGPDGKVYFNNGLSAAEIYPTVQGTGDGVKVARCNFRWDPKTGEVEATSGNGQYGGGFDEWGRHFFCSNRNPLMFAVMPYEAVLRNPHAGITQGWEDIAPAGAATRVFPKMVTHTTSDAHAGTNTACSGLGVYRGELMPELKNQVFVPDPTGQLVTRYAIAPSGATLRATRVGERTEFFRSGDEWCRPVNMTTGPDGAIYICDIYRRWIDHARFFPESFVMENDMRQGESQGRIWRVVPKGGGWKPVKRGEVDGLRYATNFRAATEVPETAGRALFLKIAAGEAELEEWVAAIASEPEDAWMTRAVLSACEGRAGEVLAGLMAGEGAFAGQYSAVRAGSVQALVMNALVHGDAGVLVGLLDLLQLEAGQLLWWKPAFLQGLADGLGKSGGRHGVKSLTDLVAKPGAGQEGGVAEVAVLLKLVDAVMVDRGASLEQRTAALPLLAQRKWADAEPTLRELLGAVQDGDGTMLEGVLAVLKKFPVSSSKGLLFELLAGTQADLRREAVGLLVGSSQTVQELFERMAAGEFSPALVDAETRWRYLRNTGVIGELAKKLFGEPSEDRAAVIADYMKCLELPGDAVRGQAVFAQVCTACHKMGELGADVGPSLADVKVKPPEALLSDILDPNRMFEARWSAYQADMKDGRMLSGLLENETSEAVTLKLMGGALMTLPRAEIKQLKAMDRSLMPPGLEAGIDVQQMADLLAYLLGK